MTGSEIVKYLKQKGVLLAVTPDGDIALTGPGAVLTPALEERIEARKDDILAALPPLVESDANRSGVTTHPNGWRTFALVSRPQGQYQEWLYQRGVYFEQFGNGRFGLMRRRAERYAEELVRVQAGGEPGGDAWAEFSEQIKIGAIK